MPWSPRATAGPCCSGGAELAEQWRRTHTASGPGLSARDQRRIDLRGRLRRPLGEQLAGVDEFHRAPRAKLNTDPGRALPLESLRRRGTKTPAELLAEPDRDAPALTARKEERMRFELRELFALLALHELAELPSARRPRSRDERLLLTPAAVKLTQMCIEVRLAWIQAQIDPSSSRGEAGKWLPPPERLEARIKDIEGRRTFGRWHEHYNAACAYALPLLSHPAANTIANEAARAADDEIRTELAGLAIARLAQATSCADSGYIAGRREWLVSEDPDLDGLRDHPRFREFEAMYFPSEGPTPPRPRHVRQIESARYVRDLLALTARSWELEWHRRGRDLEQRTDVHVLLDWWRTELRAWELVRLVAVDHRHWPARVELIGEMRSWARRYEFAPLEVRFHRYEDEPLCDANGVVLCADAQDVADLADQRLAGMHASLPERGAETDEQVLLRTLERWQSTLRQLDMEGRAPDRMLLAMLCDRQAALWQLLKEWLAEETPDGQDVCKAAFVAQVARHDETIAERAEGLVSNGRPRRSGGKRARAGSGAGARR